MRGLTKTITLGTNSNNSSGIVLGGFCLSEPMLMLVAAEIVYATVVGNLASSSRTFNVTSPTSGFVPGATAGKDLSGTGPCFIRTGPVESKE
jgi:hypothetical protein